MVEERREPKPRGGAAKETDAMGIKDDLFKKLMDEGKVAKVQLIIKINCPVHGHVEIATEAPAVIYEKVRCPVLHCEREISEVNFWLGGIHVATWRL